MKSSKKHKQGVLASTYSCKVFIHYLCFIYICINLLASVIAMMTLIFTSQAAKGFNYAPTWPGRLVFRGHT